MTTFWIICALLLVVAVLFVAVPLWRGTSRNNAVVRDAANLEIYRDQIAEMDADLRNGLLTPELHEQGTRELQSRLLDEVQQAALHTAPVARHPLKVLTIAIAVLLPLASVGLYYKIGNLEAFEPLAAHGGASGAAMSMEDLIQAMEAKVAKNPDDAETQLQLARAYVELGRYTEAIKLYDKLTKVVSNEAWLWADYADALAMANRSLQGEPDKLIKRALAIEPAHPKSLWLAGTAAMERADYALAIKHWQKLRALVPNDSEEAKMLDGGIQEARQLASHLKGGKAPKLEAINPPAQASSGKERISGKVVLSDALKNKFGPDDTVFVLARAVDGPKMPLAILRKQVRDLPLTFELDDSSAMSPEMRISNFGQVMVVVRISKSGEAMPKPGDGQGMSSAIKPGSKNVTVTVDQLVK
jgi:cytochrome c-type biogenesis protein CcmH